MPQATAADELELQNRIDEIKELIVKPLKQREIVRYCLEKHPEWNVTDRQLRNYVYEAHKQLRKAATEIDFAEELMLTKLRNEFAMAMSAKIQDYRTYASINKQNADLLNLKNLRYEPQWKDDARKAGFDPDELVKGLFGSMADISEFEWNETTNADETDQ